MGRARHARAVGSNLGYKEGARLNQSGNGAPIGIFLHMAGGAGGEYWRSRGGFVGVCW